VRGDKWDRPTSTPSSIRGAKKHRGVRVFGGEGRCGEFKHRLTESVAGVSQGESAMPSQKESGREKKKLGPLYIRRKTINKAAD